MSTEPLPGEADELSGYGKPADMWSLGGVLYIMLSGSPPFDSDGEESLCAQIVEGKWDFDVPAWDEISAEAKSLVRRLMTLRPSDRLTAHEVLSDPWLQSS